MSTADTLQTAAFATREGDRYIHLNLIQASAFNPRKRFNQAKLDELAHSIETQGVLQSIIVRPLPDARRGQPQFEIVAGERRWRACKLIADRRNETTEAVIPAQVRDIDEFTARHVALTENAERDDLHPLEEAEAFEALLLHPVRGGEFSPPRLRGYSVDELAARVGKSRGYVFGRLKLLDLIPEARTAFFEDKLQTKSAEALARHAPADQVVALEHILQGWGGEPLSHREVLGYLRNNFMLKLSDAVFDIADATLLPAAGSCQACPKRTGANPDLFSDIKGADSCTDGACFESKKLAQIARVIAQARDAGIEVITDPAEVRKISPYGTARHNLAYSGRINIDDPAEDLTGSKEPLRKLLGADIEAKCTLLAASEDELPVSVVTIEDLRAVLKSRGMLKATAAPRSSAAKQAPAKTLTREQLLKQRDRRISDIVNERLPGALWKHLQADAGEGFPQGQAFQRALADTLHEYVAVHVDALAQAVTGGSKVGADFLDNLGAEELARVNIIMLISHLVESVEYRHRRDNDDGEAAALTDELGFALEDWKRDIDLEVDSQLEEEIGQLEAAAKKSAEKKAPKGTSKKPAKSADATPEKALASALKNATAKPAKGGKKEAPAVHLSAAAADPFHNAQAPQ